MRHRLWIVVLSLVLLAGLVTSACQPPPAATTAAPEEPAKAPTVAPVEPTEAPAEEPAPGAGSEVVVTVNDVPFTLDDLHALEQVTVEAEYKGETKEYTGVRIQDLLEAAGAEGGVLVMVADDGYEAQVPVASLTEDCLLAYRKKGGLRAVLPGMESSSWVKGVVEVRCTGDESAGGAIEVTDALERVVAFSQLPQRIVVPGKGSWMVGHPLYLFPEATERVLAMEARRGTVSEFIASIEPGFNDKPHLEQDAAPEQIAPLKPDAIILKSYMAENLGKPLEELGFPVVYVELETPEQFFRDVATIGQLFDNEARAQEVAAFYQARLDRIEQGLEGLGEADRPCVLVLQYMSTGEESAFQVPPASWMQTIQVEAAGGTPVWKDAAGAKGWQVVNFEQIAAWDPDKIFVIVFRADPDPVMEQLKADPKWQALRAVQNGELYAFPADFYGWDVPDPRWILGMTWAATKIHPERFADVDITQEVYEFYGQMYGMDQAAVDEHIVPQLKGDVP
jgi:iron complex transport system substrate-binding protein